MDCTFCPLKHIHSMLGQPTIDRNCIDGDRGNVIIRDCRVTGGNPTH